MQQRLGIIGGSGLGQALLAQAAGQSMAVETPFGAPSADPMLLDFDGVPVVFLARHGIGHVYNPSQVPYRANIWALKSLGCRWILASGAVGSLQDFIAPRDLVLPDQIIDKTTRRIPTFFDDPAGGAVHVEFAEPFCPQLRQILLRAAGASGPTPQRQVLRFGSINVHSHGIYVCMEGPAFSTRAESLLHRGWGADLIGMTAMPEAKLAREAEISYALIALATDYDCWKPHAPGQTQQALLEEIIGHLHSATDNALNLIRVAIPLVWSARDQPFPAHGALALAIWSDKSQIPPAVRQKLDLLWGRYF